MITNRINYSSESDDTNAGRTEMFFLFFNRTSAAGGERRQYGKVLKYEDRLEIESGLKEHMTFTELGEKLGRDRTTITKEIRNYSDLLCDGSPVPSQFLSKLCESHMLL